MPPDGNDPSALALSRRCSTTELRRQILLQNNRTINTVMFDHLKSRNTHYVPHFRFAFGAGIVLLLAGFASIIHAVFPDILTGYSERKTNALARLSKNRNAK